MKMFTYPFTAQLQSLIEILLQAYKEFLKLARDNYTSRCILGFFSSLMEFGRQRLFVSNSSMISGNVSVRLSVRLSRSASQTVLPQSIFFVAPQRAIATFSHVELDITQIDETDIEISEFGGWDFDEEFGNEELYEAKIEDIVD